MPLATNAMSSFSARIFSLGINPCVNVPDEVLGELFKQAGITKGPIPVTGKLNGTSFKQTLVKYKGAWRLYLNTQMRQDAKVDVGDRATIHLQYDPEPRKVPMHPTLAQALRKSAEFRAAFETLPPSRQTEILRYLNSLKTEASVVHNIERVRRHLLGKRTQQSSFLGRRRV